MKYRDRFIPVSYIFGIRLLSITWVVLRQVNYTSTFKESKIMYLECFPQTHQSAVIKCPKFRKSSEQIWITDDGTVTPSRIPMKISSPLNILGKDILKFSIFLTFLAKP
ncbi:hypothetical protein CEXT_313891 [Caerostris extrusa]|uniref:Uncharacterized protein n=1 Tax=Caerostris extrusa TaxID=172846 RepID=A0AAV4MTN5_CAEEX|nr:hypothetical protein CEXT_313891 [Caerostris extrusa]